LLADASRPARWLFTSLTQPPGSVASNAVGFLYSDGIGAVRTSSNTLFHKGKFYWHKVCLFKIIALLPYTQETTK